MDRGMRAARPGVMVASALLALLSCRSLATDFSDLDGGAVARVDRAGPSGERVARPAESYRLLGAVDDGYCAGVLDALNQPGQYVMRGNGDALRWWLDVPGLVEFTPQADRGALPEFPSTPVTVEVAVVDLDGDGNREYVYRAPRAADGRAAQQLVIYDRDVRDDGSTGRRPRTVCATPGCDADNSGVDVVVLRPRQPGHGNVRWASDSDAMLRAAHAGQPGNGAAVPRAGNASWFVLDLGRGAALLAVPSDIAGRKPFEIGVFRPSRTTADTLQCVIAPDFWWVAAPHRIIRQRELIPVPPQRPEKPHQPPRPPKPPKEEKPEKPEKPHQLLKPHIPRAPHKPKESQGKE